MTKGKMTLIQKDTRPHKKRNHLQLLLPDNVSIHDVKHLDRADKGDQLLSCTILERRERIPQRNKRNRRLTLHSLKSSLIVIVVENGDNDPSSSP